MKSWLIAPTHLLRKLVSSPAHDGDCVIEVLAGHAVFKQTWVPWRRFLMATRADVIRGRCARFQSVLL